jgi:hypothetical protein
MKVRAMGRNNLKATMRDIYIYSIYIYIYIHIYIYG